MKFMKSAWLLALGFAAFAVPVMHASPSISNGQSSALQTGGRPPHVYALQTGGRPPHVTALQTGGRPPHVTALQTGGRPPHVTALQTGGRPPHVAIV